jgi:hypothetical protein
MHILITKLKSVDMREYSLDQVNIPRMYFQEQPADFENNTEYLSDEFKAIVQHDQDNEKISNNNAGPAPKRQNDMSTRDIAKRMRNA